MGVPKGYKWSEDAARHRSEGIRKAYRSGKQFGFRVTKTGFTGADLTPESRQKTSASVKRAFREGRLVNALRPLNQINPSHWREQLKSGVKKAWAEGRRHSEMSVEVRAKLSEATKQAWLRGECHGVPHKEETKKLLSIKTREAYSRGVLPPKPPTTLEKGLGRILARHFPGEWMYTGDKPTIEGYRPDFINCNGKKLIIEAFGCFWHKVEEEEVRKRLFAGYGYKTLVIWEQRNRKLDECEVVETVRRFLEVS